MIDCIVVGGGLLGILTTRYLHDDGAKVLLIERGRIGGESSWAGGGILSPLYPWRYPQAVTRLAIASQNEYSRFAKELFEETGVDPEWTNSGLLVLDTADKATAKAWSKQFELSLEILHGDAVQRCEPSVAASFHEALWMPTIAQIRNPRLVKALQSSLTVRRIPYIEHQEVASLLIQKGLVKGVRTPLETLSADRVLIAAGAWSPRLIPQTATAPKIEPVRGQMIAYKAKPRTLQRIVLYNGHYLIPRRDGHILAGSTLEYVGFHKATTEEALHRLDEAASEIVPSISQYPIAHHWSGLRPGSRLGIPVIGEHPDIKGLFLNCGHFRNGVVLGLASARLAADLVQGKTPAISPAAYAITAS